MLDALCVWRCVEFFVHDPRILVSVVDLLRSALPYPPSNPLADCVESHFCEQRKTGQCFTLNGSIFLGSILVWEAVLVRPPTCICPARM